MLLNNNVLYKGTFLILHLQEDVIMFDFKFLMIYTYFYYALINYTKRNIV